MVGGGPPVSRPPVTASKMGHEVVLYERAAAWAASLSMRTTWTLSTIWSGTEYLVRQAASPVTIHLNTEATPEQVRLDNPDAIIVAVGAESAVPHPRRERKNVMTALDYAPTSARWGR